MLTKKYKYKLLGKYYRLKEWSFENITPHLPKIPIQKPTYPGVPTCTRCHKPPEIYALHTGDAWLFFWDCEGQHISEERPERYVYIVDWFPFLFGWATHQDLTNIDIKVV